MVKPRHVEKPYGGAAVLSGKPVTLFVGPVIHSGGNVSKLYECDARTGPVTGGIRHGASPTAPRRAAATCAVANPRLPRLQYRHSKCTRARGRLTFLLLANKTRA